MPAFPARTNNIKSSIIITTDLVEKAIDKLRVGSAPGPDRIPSIFFKKMKHVISEPLRIMFEVSFRTGSVPLEWKIADVIPVFKGKGSPSSVENYRPISLTSIVAKLMERVVSEQLVDF